MTVKIKRNEIQRAQQVGRIVEVLDENVTIADGEDIRFVKKIKLENISIGIRIGAISTSQRLLSIIINGVTENDDNIGIRKEITNDDLDTYLYTDKLDMSGVPYARIRIKSEENDSDGRFAGKCFLIHHNN